MNKYSGLSGGFSIQLQAIVDQTKKDLDLTLREIVIKVGETLIKLSPVGNPELWAENAVAAQYNEEVANHNAALRDNADNLTKAGRLRKGLKVDDSMDVKGAAGYVGGRFRGNWQFTIGSPASGTVEAIDPNGAETLGKIIAGAGSLEAGDVAYIVNNLPYAVPLEHGHSTQAPAGMVRITTERFQSIVSEIIARRKT
ncbi:hypothetical protein [Pseudomonas sp. 11/12A]|uniref:hypothetical protein n=1 Tax=Pseudomonas sp. 11/12A TaxID=1506582 RepID=UPI0006475F8B|nr:hypothetical protein [Pseudomonas sp. 11/12A]